RVLRLDQNLDERLLIEIVKRGNHGEPADELGDEAELEEILGLDVAQDLAGLALLRPTYVGAEADRGAALALGDDLLEPGKGAAADEEDIGGVDLEELLLRVLAPALGRHARDGAFHDLEERLLNAFARDIAGDRGIVRLAADLVDLVDVNDAALGALDVVVRRLQELEDDVLDVLADIPRLGQRRGVSHGEGNVDDAGERLSQERLARARGADQQIVRFGELDVVVLGAVGEALVVIVHGDRQHLLGVGLPDHIVVEHEADITRRRHPVARADQRSLVFLPDDVHAELDALIADEDRRPGNELAHLVLTLPAEGAVQGILGIATGGLVHANTVKGVRPSAPSSC